MVRVEDLRDNSTQRARPARRTPDGKAATQRSGLSGGQQRGGQSSGGQANREFPVELCWSSLRLGPGPKSVPGRSVSFGRRTKDAAGVLGAFKTRSRLSRGRTEGLPL